MIAFARSAARRQAKQRLRLWIRLLRVTRAVEAELRERLRVQFELTLPQFDVLAALHREENGMTMTELSRRLMVSNGNVTGIVDRLVPRNASSGARPQRTVVLSTCGSRRKERRVRTSLPRMKSGGRDAIGFRR